MKLRRLSSVSGILASLVLVACACRTAQANPGKAEEKAARQLIWATANNGDTGIVVGTVRRVGNEPFSYLVITDAEGYNWYPDKEAQKVLRAYEMRKVRVIAVVNVREMILANDKRLPDHKELTSVRLLD